VPTLSPLVIAGHAVDELAQDVYVAGVTGRFFEHVNQDPAQRDASPNQAVPVASRSRSSMVWSAAARARA
jgi:hypothetical protein